MRMVGRWPIVVLLLLLPSCSPADPPAVFTATLGKVMDGDSFYVKADGRKVEVRLQGVDCPEKGQPFGDEARQFTREFLKGRALAVEGLGRDDYGRTLARVSAGGRDLALELVRAGLAWHYTRYSSDRELAAAEREAQRAERGLWAEARPIPPWKWRQNHPPHSTGH
jgi:endonuclease YncB( thermonuclease family)